MKAVSANELTPSVRQGGRRGFAAAVTAAFVLVAAFQISRHVMWFDEWQSWLLVKDARSIPGLFRNLHYETHPALWHLCLYAISRVSGDFHAMQLFHLLVAAGGVFIVAAYSPLSRLQAALYAFGFFVAYEYCVISRSYVLGLFLTLLAVMLFRRGPGRLGFYLILAVLAQVDAFSVAIALALGAADLTRLGWSMFSGSPPSRARMAVTAVGTLIVAVSCVAAYLQIMPPLDCSYPNTHGLRNPLATLGSLFSVWLPIPQFSPHFWNTNILDGVSPDSQLLQAINSGVLFAMALVVLSSSPEALVLLASGCAGILFELYLSRQTAFRHSGHLFILLIAAYWIAETSGRLPDKYKVARRRFLTAILIAQLVPSAWAFYVERTLPFSESKAVADFIKANFAADIPIVAGDDMAGTSISGYIGRPVYFESREAYGTYLIWDGRRQEMMLDPFPGLIDFQAKCKRDVIFLVPPYWISDKHYIPPPQLHLQVLKEFGNAIYFRDIYEVVLAKYQPDATK